MAILLQSLKSWFYDYIGFVVEGCLKWKLGFLKSNNFLEVGDSFAS